ncbi:primosomal replication protein N [Limnobacter sp.]|uniref:primosomal replication protein N n=1 Tax=Limnobacter sp. TaxID=2003368 RepID=UPI00258EE392|nr:primosomal replication protein N [Limnobacter sp.]
MNQEEADTSQPTNQFELQATLISKSILRYTPAGVPVCEMELQHESVQIEASKPRTVQCVIDAISLGSLANSISKLELGSEMIWSGFIALRSHKQKKLQFHICNMQKAARQAEASK